MKNKIDLEGFILTELYHAVIDYKCSKDSNNNVDCVYLSGYKEGKKASSQMNVLELLKTEDRVVIDIPSNVLDIDCNYLEGLIKPWFVKLKSVKNFKKRIVFNSDVEGLNNSLDLVLSTLSKDRKSKQLYKYTIVFNLVIIVSAILFF